MSGTYNSRVFSFIHSQTHKLKDSCVKGWRHFKVAVVWTGQILVYPFHRLAETTKLFTAQPASTPAPRLAPTQPPADITIEAALDLVALEGYSVENSPKKLTSGDDWSFIDEDLWDTSLAPVAIKEQSISYTSTQPQPITTPRPVIRGLSSLLANRNLVLVTTENEILDVLTRQQQQELQMRVSKELATKLLQGDTTQLPALAPQPPQIHRELPPLPRPQNSQKWWHKLIHQPVSPTLGLVGTPPSITNHQPSSLAEVPTEIVKAIAPSLGENRDRSQISTQNRPSPGIVNRVKQLWKYYREYIQVDLPDEVVERSLTTTHEPLSGFLDRGDLQKKNTPDRSGNVKN